MTRKKLQKLSKEVQLSINNAEQTYKETRKAAQELSRTAALSPSHSGDREHADQQAYLVKARLEKLKELEKELDSFIDINPPNKVVNPCYVTLILENEENNLYFINNPANLEGYKFITPSSALGKVIEGKKKGQSLSLIIRGKKVSGKIINIE